MTLANPAYAQQIERSIIKKEAIERCIIALFRRTTLVK